MTRRTAWTDEKTEAVIGNLLRAGVLLAAAVVLCGGILYLFSHRGPNEDLRHFHSEPDELRSVTGVIHGAAHVDSRAIIQLGLLLLVLTPIARVLFAAVAFALERDFLYVLISLVVLALLIVGLLGTG
jgi:uncharacterized membrane protein